MIKSNPIPTRWRTNNSKMENNKAKKFSHCCEGSEPHIRLPSLRTQQRAGESDLEGQWDLITRLPQDLEKQRLQSYRTQTKHCAHQGSEERSSDSTRD